MTSDSLQPDRANPGPSTPPGTSPLEIPVSVFSAALELERPLQPGNREGANLGTTLRGAFFGGLWDVACLEGSRPGCLDCRRPADCPARVLVKPRSEAQKRDHPSPVILRLAPEEGGKRLNGTLVLWGRRARAHESLIGPALELTGRRGLIDARGRVTFTETRSLLFDGPLIDFARKLVPEPAPVRALLEFASACSITTADLTALIGGAAHDLVQWDLDDRGLATVIGRTACEAIAKHARHAAAATLSGVTVEGGHAEHVELGARRSGHNGHRFQLGGYSGHAVLGGDLGALLPWLVVLVLRGGGGRKTFGMGETRIWYPDAERGWVQAWERLVATRRKNFMKPSTEAHSKDRKHMPLTAQPSYLSLLRYFDDAFWRGVAEHTIADRSKAPAKQRDRIDSLLRQMPVSGFRAAIKAPAKLQAGALLAVMRRSAFGFRAVLSAWIHTMGSLRQEARRLLADADLPVVDSLDRPLPFGTWEPDRLVALTRDLATSNSADVQNVILMLCAVSGLVPAPSQEDEDPEGEEWATGEVAPMDADMGSARPPEGEAADDLDRILARLRAAPLSAQEWVAAESFVRDLEVLRRSLEESIHRERADVQADLTRLAAEAETTLRYFGAEPSTWILDESSSIQGIREIIAALRDRLSRYQAAECAPRFPTLDEQRRHRAMVEELEKEIGLELARLSSRLQSTECHEEGVDAALAEAPESEPPQSDETPAEAAEESDPPSVSTTELPEPSPEPTPEPPPVPELPPVVAADPEVTTAVSQALEPSAAPEAAPCEEVPSEIVPSPAPPSPPETEEARVPQPEEPAPPVILESTPEPPVSEVSEVSEEPAPEVSSSTSSNPWDVVWNLAATDRLGLAYQIASCLERLETPRPEGAPSASLLRIAALSPLVSTPTDDLRDLLTRPLQEVPADMAVLEDEGGSASPVGLLALGALLRPALLGPPRDAATALRSVPLASMPALGRLRDAVLDFTRLGLVLSPTVLRDVREREDWDRLYQAFQARTRQALVSLRQSKLIFAATTDVWRVWLEPEGLLGCHLEGLLGSEPPAVAKVQQARRDWADEAFVKRRLERTDKELRGSGAARRPIEARAIKGMLAHVALVLAILDEWQVLMDRQPGATTGRHQGGLDQCRRGFRSALPQAQSQLEELASSGNPWLMAASRFTSRAIMDLAALFDPASKLAEPITAFAALAIDLLRVPGILLTEASEAVSPVPSALLAELVALAEKPQPDWAEVFRAHCAHRNHHATEKLLELARTGSIAVENLAALTQEHEDGLARSVSTFGRLLSATDMEVTRAAFYDLLPEKRINDLHASVAAFQPEAVRNFPLAEKALLDIRAAIDAARAERVAEVRSRLAALGEAATPAARSRIDAALGQGDFLTATEFVDMAERRQPLPEPVPADAAFEHFFRGSFIKELAELVSQRVMPTRTLPFPRWVAKEVGSGHSVGPVDLSQVPPGRLASAEALLNAWYAGKQRTTPFKGFIVPLLTNLGFSSVAVDSTPEPGNERRWSTRVRTEVVADPMTCSIPEFGSLARGHYRILCVWDQPAVEEIVRWAEPDSSNAPILVLYFGVLSQRQRRELAQLCRERHRTLLVIDEALIFFLCTIGGERLAALFRCTVPFTIVHPYVTGLGLVPIEMFYGRERERREVWSQMGTNLVFGGRQLGKTALLRDVERRFHNPAQGQIVRWIDLKNEMLGVNRPVDEIWTVLARALRKEGVVPATASAPGTIEDRVVEWLEEDKRRRILLLLDEADLFLEADQQPGAQQFKNMVRLKGIMEKTERRFKVVFAGLHNVQRTSRAVNTPMAHLGRPICIGPLLEDGEAAFARQLIEVPFRDMGVRFDPADLPMRILSLTNYYPSLIQTLCKHLHARLSNPKLTSFDTNLTPPYVVTSRLLDDAQTRDVRDEMVKLFELTLDLDPRYRVIALLLAYTTVSEVGERYFERGFDVPWVREELLSYEAASFRNDTSAEAVRTIMDEMIGLGILRRTAGERYSLRSPNVVNLLGTKEEIQRKLLDALEKQAPEPYAPEIFRRTLKDSLVRSPLSARQESTLLLGTGVSVVLGSRMAGRDHLGEAIKAATDGSDYDLHEAKPLSSAAECLRWLDEVVREGHDHPIVALVGAQSAWDGSWIEQASQWTAKRSQRKKALRVVFVGGGEAAWRWVNGTARRSLAENVSELTLRPWAESVLEQWARDTAVAPGSDSLAEVYRLTGGWPDLVYAFGRACRAGGTSWRANVESLASEATGKILPQFEIPPAAEAILREAAQYPPLHDDDLEGLAGDPEEVRKTFAWADLLGLVQRVERGCYAIDPVLARVLTGSA